MDYEFLSVFEKIVEKRGKTRENRIFGAASLKVLEDVLQKIQLNIIHTNLAKPPYLNRKICKAWPLVTAKIRQDFLDLYHQPTSPTVPDKQ